MTDGRERAAQPEDITRLVVERVNAGDAEERQGSTSRLRSLHFRPGR